MFLVWSVFSTSAEVAQPEIVSFFLSVPYNPLIITWDEESSLKAIQYEKGEIPFTLLNGTLRDGYQILVNNSPIQVRENRKFEIKVGLRYDEREFSLTIIDPQQHQSTYHFTYRWKKEKTLPFLRMKVRENGEEIFVIKKVSDTFIADEWVSFTWKEPKFYEKPTNPDWARHVRAGFIAAYTKSGGSSSSLLFAWSPMWKISQTYSFRAALMGSILRYNATNLLYLGDLSAYGGYELR